jgi:hypothetical protein
MNAVNTSVGKALEICPIGRLTRRREKNIKAGLNELGRGNQRWMDLFLDCDQWRALVLIILNLPRFFYHIVTW